MKHHPASARAVEFAAISAAWQIMAEPLRIAARDHGYAIALHGSMARDLDLIAVPWVEHGADDPDDLVMSLCGVLRGIFGRANRLNGWTEKPHGRRAITIMVWGGWQIDVDLSVLPRVEPVQAHPEGQHASDCATNNGPAVEPGPCDCGAA